MTHSELEIAIREWSISLKQRGLSPTTIDKYEWHLNRFTKWLAERGVTDPGVIKKALLREYGASLYDGWSVATVHQSTSALRSFLRWCRDEEIINVPLLNVLRLPKVKANVQRTLSAEEVWRLIAVCDNSVIGIRNRALVSLMVDSGLRATEVCRLAIDHIQTGVRLGEGFVNILTVQGKGGTVLPAYFGDDTAAYLQAWLNVRVALPAVDTVFVGIGGTKPGSSLTRHGLKNILKKIGDRVGVAKVSPHVLRRAFACIAHDAGASTRQIREWGRWSNLQMVERYTSAYSAGARYSGFSPMDYVTRTRNP